MEISIFLARFLGGMYIILGLLSLRAKFLGKTIERTENEFFIVSTGYISMLLGLATVVLHNVWVADWRVAITILGWATLLKGIMKMGFPRHIHKQAQRFKNKQEIESIILLIMGAVVFWFSL
jgi:hypothetical protein